MTGLDALRDDPTPVRGKRIGIVTNHTGINAALRPTAEELAALGAEVKALFGPEHGYYGVLQDADTVANETMHVPAVGEVPMFSLYGGDDDFGVPAGVFDGLDMLVYDIQDVGVRFYTYLSTLGIVLEAASAAGLPLLVIDRPNPIGGRVEGPGLDPDCRSFVGYYDHPIRHGMTMGEAARYLNQYKYNGRGEVLVAPAVGWNHSMWFPDTGNTWVAPSPNIPSFDTTVVYPGTCLFEGLNMSEGRGTTQPFELIGAPFIDPFKWADYLNKLDLPGVRFRPTYFMPAFNRFANEVCGGVQVHPTDRHVLKPVLTGLHMVIGVARLYPEQDIWRVPPPESGLYHFDRLIGSKKVRPAIEQGASAEELAGEWTNDEQEFIGRRANILLYD